MVCVLRNIILHITGMHYLKPLYMAAATLNYFLKMVFHSLDCAGLYWFAWRGCTKTFWNMAERSCTWRERKLPFPVEAVTLGKSFLLYSTLCKYQYHRFDYIWLLNDQITGMPFHIILIELKMPWGNLHWDCCPQCFHPLFTALRSPGWPSLTISP